MAVWDCIIHSFISLVNFHPDNFQSNPRLWSNQSVDFWLHFEAWLDFELGMTLLLTLSCHNVLDWSLYAAFESVWPLNWRKWLCFDVFMTIRLLNEWSSCLKTFDIYSLSNKWDPHSIKLDVLRVSEINFICFSWKWCFRVFLRVNDFRGYRINDVLFNLNDLRLLKWSLRVLK